jgi:hypothetical protein
MSARAWLRGEARRARAVAWLGTAFAMLGGAAGSLGLGLVLERVGAFRLAPMLVALPWVGAVVAAGAAWWWRRAAHGEASPVGVGTVVEGTLHLRTGELAGVADPAQGSAALADLADRRMAEWLAHHASAVREVLNAARRRDLSRTAVLALTGIAFLGTVDRTGGGAYVLWRPIAFVAMSRAPVRLAVDRASVRRGDLVHVAISAPGGELAELHQRRAGETWRTSTVSLVNGTGAATVGPVDADLLLFAVSGRRRSDTVRVALRPSLFLTDVDVTARLPAYLDQPDMPLSAEGDTVPLPIGTRVELSARASLAVESAAWEREGDTVAVNVAGTSLHGGFPVMRSGTWRLAVRGTGAATLEGAAPALTIVAVPDSAPVVALVVPSADTVMPTSLIQPLVAEVRDDHRVGRVEIISRRVSRLGTRGAPMVDTASLPAEGVERAVVTAPLDLNHRGFLPGDTAYVRVRAYDLAPHAHVGETPELRLRLPSLSDLRQAVREETRALRSASDSLADKQRDLGRSVQEMSQERSRDPTSASGQERQLDYQQAERAGAVNAEQRRIIERADSLRARVDRLEQQAWDAGITDPAWHEQLKELRELLNRAMTPEVREALAQLENALHTLNPEAMRNALQRLAAAQDQLRHELEQSRSLFERAALEGDLTALAQDAKELAARQAQWNEDLARSHDSTAAREEATLAAAADSLAARLANTQADLQRQGGDSAAAGAPRARAAAQHMQRASQAASAGNRPGAAEAGRQASEQLDPLAQDLTQQRDALRTAWRQDVMESLDRALAETAGLARTQQEIEQRLKRGESGTDVLAQQGANRDGLDQVLARIRDAAGKNALVSPALGARLGYARNRMGAALDQLQQGSPNTPAADEAAGDALDGLNSLALLLLRSRADVQGAQSGSGLAEAIERMAQLAQQQGQMAGQSNGLLPLMQSAGESVMLELRELARQQRALAQELERMRSQGDLAGAEALAKEADEIARQLEQGALTRDVVERQEQLYRRLLDQGRTLRGPEADEQKERQSTTARPGNVRLPTGEIPRAGGPRYPYPTWQDLQGLSPAERRAVLDYFRMLNDATRHRQ